MVQGPIGFGTGIAPPSLDQTQIDAIPAADLWNGRQVYNTTTGLNQIYGDGSWVALTTSAGFPVVPSSDLLGGDGSAFTSISAGGGLTISGGVLEAVTGGGLTTSAGALVPVVSHGLAISGTAIAAVVGGGLTVSGNTIVPTVGGGLTVSGGTIITSGGVVSSSFVTSAGLTVQVRNGIITNIA